MKVDFAGSTRRDPDNRGANSARLVNCYREPLGGRSQMVLKRVPGLVEFGTTGAAFLRAMAVVDGEIYTVASGTLYRVTVDGRTETIGSVDDDENTAISGNNGAVTVTANGKYYLWDGTTLSQPTTGALSTVGSVTYLGFRTILTEKDGRAVQWSTINSGVPEPQTMNALDFASAEQTDDNIVRAVASGSLMYVFKERSTEIWGVGTDGPIFLAGRVWDVGLKSFNLVCEMPEGVFFVGHDGIAYIASGGSRQPVSPKPIDTAINQGRPTHCTYHAVEGAKFLTIRFSDRASWVFDIGSGEWHERALGVNHEPWPIVATVNAHAGYFAGSLYGDLGEFANYPYDLGQLVVCEATSRTFEGERDRFRIREIEFQGRVGVAPLGLTEIVTLMDSDEALVLAEGDLPLGIGGGLGSEVPQVEMFTSGDYGLTWDAPRRQNFGELGDYDHRIVFGPLGQFRQFTARLRWSNIADTPIDAEAYLEAL